MFQMELILENSFSFNWTMFTCQSEERPEKNVQLYVSFTAVFNGAYEI